MDNKLYKYIGIILVSSLPILYPSISNLQMEIRSQDPEFYYKIGTTHFDNVGRLPMYRMEEITHDLHYSGGWRERRRSAWPSFESQKCPKKAKEKKVKRSKPRSTKPKFKSPHFVEGHDDWYRSSERADLDERDGTM